MLKHVEDCCMCELLKIAEFSKVFLFSAGHISVTSHIPGVDSA